MTNNTASGTHLTSADALLVLDVRNGFLPGGGLGVEPGHTIIPIVNRIAAFLEVVMLTQDWHPPRPHLICG
jgi:nicotinamidase-related amidase